MVMDRIDNSRQDAKRLEKKKAVERKDLQQKKASQDFSSKYQSQLKDKEVKQTREAQKYQEKAAGDLLSRVISAFRNKKDGQKQENRKESRKEDLKKEQVFEDGDKQTSSSKKESHARVESNQSDQREGKSSGSGGGGAGADQGSKGGGQSGSQFGGGKQFSGSDTKDKQEQSAVKSNALKKGETSFPAPLTGSSFSSGSGGEGSQPDLSKKDLDQIVESVRLGMNENLDQELEIQLSEDYFQGLRFKVSQSQHGVILSFTCPNAAVRDLFFKLRPKIYARLKVKNIPIYRIEVS